MLVCIINTVWWFAARWPFIPISASFRRREANLKGQLFHDIHAFFSYLLILELYASPSNIASTGMATGDCTWGDIWDFQLLKSWKKDSSQIFEVTCCCFTWQPCWSWCQPQRRWNILQLGKWGENLETKGRHLENLRDRFRGLEGKIAGNPT